MKRTSFNRIVLSFALSTGAFLSVGIPSRAEATGLVAGATEPTQILNNIQLIQSYITQLQQLSQQVAMYENMLQNTAQLPFAVWGQVSQDLQQIASVVQVGQGLSYTMQNMDAAFTDRFKGYRPTQNYSQNYQQWSQTSLDTIRGTLRAVNLQGSQVANEVQLIESLKRAALSPTGQVQAIQAGLQIGEQQVEQLQKLRVLMLSQMDAQNTYLASQQAGEAAVQANIDAQTQFSDPTLAPAKTYKPGVY